jgi:hypothetical protein
MGCMDKCAINFDNRAVINDGCTYVVEGCNDPNATNYIPSSIRKLECTYKIEGCTFNNPSVTNYNIYANSYTKCNFNIYGCTDSSYFEYNMFANIDDNSCEHSMYECNHPDGINYNEKALFATGCIYKIQGCTDSTSLNYNALANVEICKYKKYGCMNPLAINFDIYATNDFNCVYQTENIPLPPAPQAGYSPPPFPSPTPTPPPPLPPVPISGYRPPPSPPSPPYSPPNPPSSPPPPLFPLPKYPPPPYPPPREGCWLNHNLVWECTEFNCTFTDNKVLCPGSVDTTADFHTCIISCNRKYVQSERLKDRCYSKCNTPPSPPPKIPPSYPPPFPPVSPPPSPFQPPLPKDPPLKPPPPNYPPPPPFPNIPPHPPKPPAPPNPPKPPFYPPSPNPPFSPVYLPFGWDRTITKTHTIFACLNNLKKYDSIAAISNSGVVIGLTQVNSNCFSIDIEWDGTRIFFRKLDASTYKIFMIQTSITDPELFSNSSYMLNLEYHRWSPMSCTGSHQLFIQITYRGKKIGQYNDLVGVFDSVSAEVPLGFGNLFGDTFTISVCNPVIGTTLSFRFWNSSSDNEIFTDATYVFANQVVMRRVIEILKCIDDSSIWNNRQLTNIGITCSFILNIGEKRDDTFAQHLVSDHCRLSCNTCYNANSCMNTCGDSTCSIKSSFMTCYELTQIGCDCSGCCSHYSHPSLPPSPVPYVPPPYSPSPCFPPISPPPPNIPPNKPPPSPPTIPPYTPPLPHTPPSPPPICNINGNLCSGKLFSDINDDGIISYEDYDILKHSIVNSTKYNISVISDCVDWNNNNRIDGGDLILLSAFLNNVNSYSSFIGSVNLKEKVGCSVNYLQTCTNNQKGCI